MYTAASVKRQKIVREATRSMETPETYQGIGRIEYKPDAPFSCDEQLTYRYYNALERIHGRPMEEWLRPAVMFNPYIFGNTQQTPSLQKTFENANSSLECTKKSLRAMFELCLKMGVKFWAGYEADLIPNGATFEEANANVAQISELINEYQQKTGVRPLWIGVNFQHGRFANGAMTNPDANVMAYAGYRTKQAIDMAHKLNAECFLINGHRENYDNAMGTDLAKELKHYARFLKLLIEHGDKIGFRGQLLFAQNDIPARNYDHRDLSELKYTANANDAMLLLKHLNHDRYFKLNARPGHEFNMAHAYGCLGGIDVISAQDSTNLPNITQSLRVIIEKGGFGQCGITFNLPIYGSYAEAKEVIETYLFALDLYGRALRLAVKLVNEAPINKQLQTRYASYQTGWGMRFMTLDASLQECEDIVKRLCEANTLCTSNKSNHWFVFIQRFVDSQNLK